ncbi:preprotein translocase subunit YajC [Bombilactobacillus apium]
MGGNYTVLIFFVLMIGLMYFTMIRPQKKQQEKRKQMLNAIKVGDPVVTIGGLHGTIDSMNDADQTVVLDCDGIYLTFSRSAIRAVSQPATSTPVKTEDKPEVEATKTLTPESEASPAETTPTDDSEK